MHDPRASSALQSIPRAIPTGEATDTPARLLRAVTSLAHSVAVQIAATAAVTVAVATIPWLHESAPVPASPAPAATAAAGAAPGALELAGIMPSTAFPMEGDARFGLALHRTYQVVADATWSDGTPVETAQQASPPRPAKRRAVAQGATEATTGTPAAPVSVAVLPPERPFDLASPGQPRERPMQLAELNAPVEARQDGILGRVAGLGLPALPAVSLPLPPLPSVRDVSHEIGSRAEEARQAVTRTASWAADGVGSVLPRF